MISEKFNSVVLLVVLMAWPAGAGAEDASGEKPLDSVSERFAQPNEEQPDFQRHVVPLLGKLGCNGRACHGSFQGQGGLQLSLFGYDFEHDYQALLESGYGRVDVDDPVESLILTKPTDAELHEGGQRYEKDSWHYHLLHNWIRFGARDIDEEQRLEKVVVSPAEIVSADRQHPIQLKAVAHWSDGTREDITPLCRFQSNDPSVAKVDEQGRVQMDDAGDTHVVVFYDNAVTTVPVLTPHRLPVSDLQFPARTEIDKRVVKKWEKLNLKPSSLADDAMFLRRVSLDMTGTLPSPSEIREFLSDERPDKRARKIDQLLNSPAYAAWWATFFCDLTGNNSQQLRNIAYSGNPNEQWYEWIRNRIADNVPYDQLVEGIVLATSREDGESFKAYCSRMTDSYRKDSEQSADFDSMPYYWMRREFQDGETRAISFAHAFMGIRIQCAQCHKHPFDQWTQHDFQQFSRFFSGVSTRQARNRKGRDGKELNEIFQDLGIDPKTRGGQLRRELAQAMKEGKTVPFPELVVHAPKMNARLAKEKKNRNRQKVYTDAILLGSDAIDLTDIEDVREPVMKWLRQKDNPYFARALVNRIWAHYFGVGIVEPADDLNLANPPSNGPLLDYLADGFVDHDYDLKWLHREIANSRVYQLSWEPNETNANDRRNFSRALPRRLPAEVVHDAIAQAASNRKANREYRSEVDRRAISVAGTQLPRSQNAGVSAFALQVFGRSTRESSCDCDRSDETSLIQTVYLQNDRDIHAVLSQKQGWIHELYGTAGKGALTKEEMKRFQQAETRLKKLRAQQKSLAAKNRKAKVEQVRKQIFRLDQRLQPYRERQQAAQSTDSKVRPEQAIREAYLRTLSRYPTEDEIDRCLTYFDEGNDLAKSMTGLLWALVNTKEFIVNH